MRVQITEKDQFNSRNRVSFGVTMVNIFVYHGISLKMKMK